MPHGFRAALPVIVVIALAATYPYYVSSLPTDVPVILAFPDVGACVTIIIFVMMAVGLNIVVGYAGLLDLGYVAFYAIGAYTAGWLASGQFQQVRFHFGSVGISKEQNGIHISIWLVLLCAGILTAVGGIIIGLPTLRLRGDYLAIVTLGFGEIIPQFVRNADSIKGFDLTHGTFGISPIDSPGFGEHLNKAIGLPVNYQSSFDRERFFFWTALALLLLAVFCSLRLRESRLGRAWIAIREDETAAGAMGIPLMRTKTWAYAIGAFFGGMAGAYIASFNSRRVPEPVPVQHLGLPALHGHPRRNGQPLGRRGRRDDPRLAERRRPCEHRQLGQRAHAAQRRGGEVPVRDLRDHHRADDAVPPCRPDPGAAAQAGDRRRRRSVGAGQERLRDPRSRDPREK